MTQFGPRLIIGDVKGKGLDAVGRCAAVLAIFRELAFGEPGLAELAEKMNARLSRDMEVEDFVTVILAEFAPGEVRIVNCGHHPPVKLALAGGGLQVMAPEEFAPPLGLNPHPARQDIDLKPGDRLLFYTDGLVESRDRAGRFFGLDDRVTAALALPDLGAAVKGVVRLLLEHAGDDLADDVLLVLGESLPEILVRKGNDYSTSHHDLPITPLTPTEMVVFLDTRSMFSWQPVEQQVVQPFRRVERHPVARAGNLLVPPRSLDEFRRGLHPLTVEVVIPS